jgi:hypothetical protein
MSHKIAIIYLLKRKVAIGMYIKVVGQITSFYMSGQRAINSIPTRSYSRYKKTCQKIRGCLKDWSITFY